MRAASLLFALFTSGALAAPSAPTVILTGDADPAIAGSDLTYTAIANGGSGAYSYLWDIDGDGVIDKTTTGNTLIARFNRETQFVASVLVRDGAGAEASGQLAVNVIAHRVRLQSGLGEPTQVCGDGDAVIEPGERWRFDGVLSNAGARATTPDAYTLISKSTSDSIPGAVRDGFGYALTDSTLGGQCSYQFIDISNQVSALQLTASGSASANDEGRTGVLDLASVGGSFNFYGQTINQLVMSTNGYLGTSPATTGGDFNNLCGAVPAADNNGKRLQVLHDNLVVAPNGGLRWAAFTECPRPSGVAPSTQSCLVFQWNNMGVYTGGATPIGDFNFQAVIYPQTWQIVYQYQNGVPNNGDGATVGILDPATTNFQLTASCNQQRVAAPIAVCYYHPQHLPAASGDLSKLRVENPFVDSGNMQPDATRPFSSFFSVEPDAACGSRYRIDVAGTADENAGNNLGGTHQFQIGATGNCNISQNCAMSLPPPVDLRPGVFFNPRRDGNGLVAHVVPISSQLPVFFAAWYTGDINRTPIWYIVQGRLQDNQVVAPILRVTRDLSTPEFAVIRQTVGTARVQLLGAEKMLFNYTLDSDPLGGIEILTHGFQNLPSPSPNRTGVWFFGQEDGWGQTYDSYVTGGVAREFITTYLYDAAGQPRWVLADGLADDISDLPTKAFQVHCPSCGWIDFADSERSAGTMRRAFVAPNAGNLTTEFVLPTPMLGNWSRSNVAISILTPVQVEQP